MLCPPAESMTPPAGGTRSRFETRRSRRQHRPSTRRRPAGRNSVGIANAPNWLLSIWPLGKRTFDNTPACQPAEIPGQVDVRTQHRPAADRRRAAAAPADEQPRVEAERSGDARAQRRLGADDKGRRAARWPSRTRPARRTGPAAVRRGRSIRPRPIVSPAVADVLGTGRTKTSLPALAGLCAAAMPGSAMQHRRQNAGIERRHARATWVRGGSACGGHRRASAAPGQTIVRPR